MHFTYEKPGASDLRQGDVLRRTAELENILREVHPHYFQKGDYRYFLVLTQSCDLVRRGSGVPSSPYIAICAVRPLEIAIAREVARYQYDNVERELGFCNEKQKEKVYQFAERLLNNNETRYFYLHRESEVGLHDENCAFLQLSVSLKASLHYETLLSARVVSLREAFQHKLGYLVGTGYSRVGTRDWVPDTENAGDFDRRKRQVVDDTSAILWLPDSQYRKVLQELKKIPADERSIQRLEHVIASVESERESHLRLAVTSVKEAVKDLVSDEDLEKVERRLRNSAGFTQSLRR